MSMILSQYGLSSKLYVNGSSASSFQVTLPDVGSVNSARFVYIVVNYGVTADGAKINLRVRDTTETTSNCRYRVTMSGTTAGSTSSNSAFMPLQYYGTGNSSNTSPTGEAGTIEMFLHNKWVASGSSLSVPHWWGHHQATYTNGTEYLHNFSGRVRSSSFSDVIKYLQFFPNTGNFSYYNFTLYHIGGAGT